MKICFVSRAVMILFGTILFSYPGVSQEPASKTDTLVLKDWKFTGFRIQTIPYTKYKTYALLDFKSKEDSVITLNYPFPSDQPAITIEFSTSCYGWLLEDSIYTLTLVKKIPDIRFKQLMNFPGSYYSSNYVKFINERSSAKFIRLKKVKGKYKKERRVIPFPYLDIDQELYEVISVTPIEKFCPN